MRFDASKISTNRLQIILRAVQSSKLMKEAAEAAKTEIERRKSNGIKSH
jgi:hypothetical protein